MEGATSGAAPTGGGPSEEELRQVYEQQIKQVRVEQLLLENVVTLLNLGMRRTGLAPGTEDERDVDQVRVAIESVRAVLPLLESSAPQHVGPIRDALSQLQMAFVRIGGSGEGAPAPDQPAPKAPGPRQESSGPSEPSAPPKPGEAGPAQRSGRLWVPGQ